MSAATRSLRRLRQILPSDGVLISYAVVFLLADLPLRFFDWRAGFGNAGDRVAPSKWLLIAGSIGLGLTRAKAFHPCSRTDYHDWLMRSPWTRGRPLPGGPVFPVPEDLFICGGLLLLAMTQFGVAPESVLNRYLVGYIIGITTPMWSAGASSYAYLVMFGLGLTARFWGEPRQSLAATAAVLCVALLGLWKTLGTISNRVEGNKAEPMNMPKLNENVDLATVQNMAVGLGWPYDILSPKSVVLKRRAHSDRILTSLLLGWLVFCACGLMSSDDGRKATVIGAFTVAVAVLGPGRFLLYRSGYASPISIWGRLATLRLIIPGYDKILVAPMLTLAVMGFALFEAYRWNLGTELAMPIAISAGLLVAYNTGPTLAEWRLTGQARLLVRVANRETLFVKTS